MRYSCDNILIFVVLCTGIGIRGIVSLSSYSGASTPPMFGDYEAQRHWQEITYNLPSSQWYLNTTDNDLLYWGIDYPPLTAYHSLFLGIIANRMNSSYVRLFESRGFESVEHKSFMRLTVLVADLFIYIPASVIVLISLKTYISSKRILTSLILLVLYPGQMLIDNGHFQYNNISLGLFIYSVACIIQNRYKWASFFFTLSLNYKQMELYHALPIFVYLLKSSFSRKSFLKNIFNLFQIGFTTLTTFLLLWIPWIFSRNSLVSTVLRLFPFNRGVFEDKVANVWCSLNALYKLKEKFQNDQMALICLVSTLLAVLPTNLHLFIEYKKKNFLFTLVNTSLSFFLLSFQVHEKTILLTAIPVCFLFNMMPCSVLSFLKVSTFSMFPLFIKDNLRVVYFCMTVGYLIIFKCFIQIVNGNGRKKQKMLKFFMDILDILILLISIATLFFPSPNRFPYLWPFVISFCCCIFFVQFLIVSNLVQYNYFFITYKYITNVMTKYY